jgi:hypothetical protein
VSLVRIIYSTLLGVFTQCTAGVRNDQMTMKYTHDEYCDIFLFPGTCDSYSGTAAKTMHYTVLVNITQSLMCFTDGSSVSVRQKM